MLRLHPKRAGGWVAAALVAVAAGPVSAARAQAPDAPPGDGGAPQQAPAPPKEDSARHPMLPDKRVAAPGRGRGATVALVVQRTPALLRPGTGRAVWTVPVNTTWSRQPMSLLVLGSADVRGVRWLQVALPIRPTRSRGWIRADHARLSQTRYWIDIRRRTRAVIVRHDGATVLRTRAVIGASETPTPSGLAAIYERNRQPNPRGFLGPWALALTATSQVLQTFDGGPGRIGLHGRDGESLRDPLGSARSHGCIRIPNRAIRWIARQVPAGAPVMVR